MGIEICGHGKSDFCELCEAKKLTVDVNVKACKFYRITYKQKSMEVEEFPFEWPDVEKRVNARCISRLPDKPVIHLITELSVEMPITRKPVEKWVNPEH